MRGYRPIAPDAFAAYTMQDLRNGKIRDRIGTTDLTIIGAVTFPQGGPRDKYATFTGAGKTFRSAAISVPGDFSLAGWVKDSSFAVSLGDDYGYPAWGAILAGNGTGVVIGSSYYASTGAVTGWHRVVGVRQGATLRFYRDGVLKATATCPTGTIRNGGSTQIYANNNYNYDYGTYRGSHIELYNRALTDKEIAADFFGKKLIIGG